MLRILRPFRVAVVYLESKGSSAEFNSSVFVVLCYLRFTYVAHAERSIER